MTNITANVNLALERLEQGDVVRYADHSSRRNCH